ncbi:unnamed protein product [Peronospora belbahrii]|uniref:Uncharacterized protein n=1 Tax=Peronospora belbahrii TaxID=622444 RepID=A0AAU9KIC7_9STRA|nr:unnamed protein product [Peronospora belbahrii]
MDTINSLSARVLSKALQKSDSFPGISLKTQTSHLSNSMKQHHTSMYKEERRLLAKGADKASTLLQGQCVHCSVAALHTVDGLTTTVHNAPYEHLKRSDTLEKKQLVAQRYRLDTIRTTALALVDA